MLPINPAIFDEQIRSGRIDLALTIRRFAPPNWFARLLFKGRFLCAVRADHPLAGTKVDIDAFCSCEHLLVSPYKIDFTGWTDRALAQIDRTRKVGLVVPSFSVAEAILEQTDLLGVLPERLLRNTNHRLYIFPPPLEIESSEIVAAWPERVDADPLHSWFRELCYDSTQAKRIDD